MPSGAQIVQQQFIPVDSASQALSTASLIAVIEGLKTVENQALVHLRALAQSNETMNVMHEGQTGTSLERLVLYVPQF